MIKTIYHGSDHIIDKPIYGQGKPYNDYGLGFYCTESIDLAKEWAVDIDRNGYANAYTLDMDSLTTLNLNDPKYCILHWLSVLLQNRNFEVTAPLPQEAKEYIISNFIDYQLLAKSVLIVNSKSGSNIANPFHNSIHKETCMHEYVGAYINE